MLQMRYENIIYLGHLKDNTYFVRKDLLSRLHRNIISTCTFFCEKKSTKKSMGQKINTKISSIPLKNFKVY